MSAIDIKLPENTFYTECIVCRTCEKICPEKAVKFKVADKSKTVLSETFSFNRRQILSTGLTGAATAILSLTGLNSLNKKSEKGQAQASGLIRPPGSVMENKFLARCVRCGECMTACPTNTLQPVWFTAGFVAVFSPALTPFHGYCDPRCHECGKVCLTDAIRPMEKSDRIWAKTGTAMIIRSKCLAWEFQKLCMVCDEVCPYDAVEFLKGRKSQVSVPHVIEDKCAGCGYCEHFCPVTGQAAIIVTPMGALRINHGKYEKHARLKGFKLQLKPAEQKSDYKELQNKNTQGSAPGFDE